MAQGDRGTLGLIKVATPSVTIGGITQWRNSAGLTRTPDATGGAVDNSFICVMDGRPMLGFTTRQLTLLSSVGISGAQLTTLDAYAQKLDKFGTRNATSRKITFGTGMLLPRSLAARQGGFAELQVDAVALSADGTTAPVAFGTAAMPAHPTPVRWTIGPAYINGTLYDLEDVTVDFGIGYEVEASGGAVWPTFCTIMNRSPSIRLSCKEHDAESILGATGAAFSAATVVSFRKLAHAGTRVAEATAEHVTIAISDGLISPEETSASQGQRKTTTLVIQPTLSGSDPIISIDTAAALDGLGT